MDKVLPGESVAIYSKDILATKRVRGEKFGRTPLQS